MVAEYGDEIFAYMRELEVSLRIILGPSLPLIVEVGLPRVPAPRPCGDLPVTAHAAFVYVTSCHVYIFETSY
jgi:hypothetical protein